jgi:hypothetical protein
MIMRKSSTKSARSFRLAPSLIVDACAHLNRDLTAEEWDAIFQARRGVARAGLPLVQGRELLVLGPFD